MITLFYFLVFLAIWHFFYESILAPSLRHGLRYEFFSLRDQLRNLKIDGLNSKRDNVVYEILDHAMCDIINSMSFITVANYILLKKDYSKDKEYKKDAENVARLMSEVKEKKLIDIDNGLRKLSTKALLINNGGWIPYLLPIAIFIFLGIVIFSQVHAIISEFNKISSRLVYGAEKLNRIPQSIKVSHL
jgi:phage pi2 protein 07